MRAGMVAPLLAALCGVGCASAYQQTYDQELGRLNSQERQRQQMEEAARAEARKYVAVVYFDVGSTMIRLKTDQWHIALLEQNDDDTIVEFNAVDGR